MNFRFHFVKYYDILLIRKAGDSMGVGRPSRKEYQALTIRLNKEIYDQLAEYCIKSGQSKTTAVQRAICAYVDQYDREQKQLQALRKK